MNDKTSHFAHVCSDRRYACAWAMWVVGTRRITDPVLDASEFSQDVLASAIQNCSRDVQAIRFAKPKSLKALSIRARTAARIFGTDDQFTVDGRLNELRVVGCAVLECAAVQFGSLASTLWLNSIQKVFGPVVKVLRFYCKFDAWEGWIGDAQSNVARLCSRRQPVSTRIVLFASSCNCSIWRASN